MAMRWIWPPRQVRSLFLQPMIIATGQGGDEVMGIGSACGGCHRVGWCIGYAVADGIGDGVGEQGGALRHIGQLRTPLFNRQYGKVDAN